jgi:hypothetical protein
MAAGDNHFALLMYLARMRMTLLVVGGSRRSLKRPELTRAKDQFPRSGKNRKIGLIRITRLADTTF